MCFRVFREYYNILSNRFFPRFCIIPLQPSRLKTILYLSVITILIFAIPIQAQWSEDGVLVQSNYNVWDYGIVPDNEGGVWVAWEEIIDGGANAITRVQRFDSDGYPYFEGLGLSAIHDSLGESGFFMGAMPTDEGGVMVVFVNETIHHDSLELIRAQKFSTAGERLFGPAGRLVSSRNIPHFKYHWMIPRAISDGQGGLWACYEEFLSTDIHVYGMNADGSLKIDGDLNIGTPITTNVYPDMCVDGDGGLYVAFFHTSRNLGPYRIAYKHVLSNGELAFEGSRIAIESNRGFSKKIYLLPDQEGGFYLATMGGGAENGRGPDCSLQKVNADRSYPWSIYGVGVNTDRGLSSAYLSRPVLMADSSVSLIMSDDGSRGAHLVRIRPSGDNYFDTLAVRLTSSGKCRSDPSAALIPTVTKDSAFAIHEWGYRIGGFNSPTQHRLRSYLIDNDGENLWEPDSVLLPGPPAVFASSIERHKSTLTTEDEVIIAARWRNSDIRTAQLLLFKLLPDGTVAGVENAVGEKQHAIPSELSILGAYPNPFNSSVKINFMVDQTGFISFVFYDLTGREISRFNQNTSRGSQSITWHPENTLGSGVYVVKLVQRGKTSNSRKIVYLK